MATPTLLLLLLALQNPKITATLAEAPGPKIVCEGAAAVPDGIILNVEIYLAGTKEMLKHELVRVKDETFKASFDLFRGRERNLPGQYRVKILYHDAFQLPNKALPNVPNFHVECASQIGTPAEIEAAHKTVRDRLSADLNGFKAVADDVVAAFDAAQGKPDPKEWKKRVEGWKRSCTDIEDRAAVDPDYKVLGYGRITQTSTEYLREKVRGLVEHAGAARAAEVRLGREQLEGMIRSILIEIAPAGSSTADRRQLVAQARGALTAALDAEGPAFAASKRAFTEAVFRLNLKASGLAQEILRQIAEDGVVYFDTADASRESAKPLAAPLDKKLGDALRELTKTE
ncbi:MAG TPA: hypothetical protein VF950_11900 [Planctomycetota bacterium]